MAPVVITNAKIVTNTRIIAGGWLAYDAGKIIDLGDGMYGGTKDVQMIDAGGCTLLPGFVDIHVHGAAGCEAMDANPDGLVTMAQFYARHGVTAFLATTWTDSRGRIEAALDVIAELRGPQPGGATLLGAHLEGPYLNPEKCGAQNMAHIRRASEAEALAFLNKDIIRLVALAPEYEENQWLIRACAQRGIVVSAAHTAATYEQIRRGVALGISQITHTFNAMSPLHQREPGTVGAALTIDELRCELIADNIHVHPAVMRLLWKTKGVEGIILITDAIRSAGQPDGDYAIDERIISVREGVARTSDGTLAGSTVTMNRAVHNFMQAVDMPLTAVWPATSLNAAKALGIDDCKGSIAVGKDADLVLVDDNINIMLTIAEGKIIYQKGR